MGVLGNTTKIFWIFCAKLPLQFETQVLKCSRKQNVPPKWAPKATQGFGVKPVQDKWVTKPSYLAPFFVAEK